MIEIDQNFGAKLAQPSGFLLVLFLERADKEDQGGWHIG